MDQNNWDVKDEVVLSLVSENSDATAYIKVRLKNLHAEMFWALPSLERARKIE